MGVTESLDDVSGSARGVPLGLVVNATARAVRQRYLRREPFWRAHVPNEFVRLTRSVEELDEAVAAFRDASVATLAVLGGDGSVHRLVDAIVRCYGGAEAPMVLALAGGTMNGLARALGTGGSPRETLGAARAALATPAAPIARRYVLRVADARDGRVRYGFGFAAGLVYRAFEEYYRSPVPGLVDALRASALPVTAALFGGSFYDDLRLDVRSGDLPWMSEAPHTVVASVTDNPLLWFKPFGEPLGDRPAFHLAVTSMRPREVAPRLWSLFRGRCRHPRLRIDRTADATVRGDLGYLIDGDLYRDGALDVHLTVGPRLRFLVPRRR